jgi:S-adenosylmethionine-diacylglycerol 3-amino-3-carboxypropyl transferase
MSDLYFSQIREDSFVERYVSEKYTPNRIIVIGSGGCTAFSILNNEVQTVYCVDHNPAQCALIELKKAAIKVLERDDFLAFIGERPCENRQSIYEKPEHQLPDYAKNYWEIHQNEIMFGINQSGVTERFYRFIGSNIVNNLYEKEVWDHLFEARSIEEQILFHEQFLTSESWLAAARILLSKTTHLQFFPAYMFEHADEQDFGNFFLHQFEKEVLTKPLQNNYFLSQLLFSTYLYDKSEGTPYYLSQEGYDKVKQNLDKLIIIPSKLQDFLTHNQSVDAFYLSNVLDWSSSHDIEEICGSVLKAASPNAVVLFRNMLSAQPLSENFKVHFDIDKELSEKCLELERSMMYQKITVGTLT